MTTNRGAIGMVAILMLMGTGWMFHETGLLRIQDLFPRPVSDIQQSEPITSDTIHYLLPDDRKPHYVNLTDPNLVEEIQIHTDPDFSRRLLISPPSDANQGQEQVEYYGLLMAHVSLDEDNPPVLCHGAIVPCSDSGRRAVRWTDCAGTISTPYGKGTSLDLQLLNGKTMDACNATTP